MQKESRHERHKGDVEHGGHREWKRGKGHVTEHRLTKTGSFKL